MIGIIPALGAALAWTYACFIWRYQANKFTPLAINYFKNIFAFLVFTPALLSINYESEYESIFILLISGVIGIGLGDTFYIKSLKLIGTRKTLSIEALSPLIAAFFGKLFIEEDIGIRSWIGILIVCICLTNINIKQNKLINENSEFIKNKLNLRDYLYPLLSVICAVTAALLSRIIFLKSNFNPFQTTEIRLLGAIIFLTIITKSKINLSINSLNNIEKIRFIFSILLGTNLGIYLQQLVFKLLPIGIGWTLLSTSPLISLFFAKREEGELSKEVVISTLLLFLGLSLVIF